MHGMQEAPNLQTEGIGSCACLQKGSRQLSSGATAGLAARRAATLGMKSNKLPRALSACTCSGNVMQHQAQEAPADWAMDMQQGQLHHHYTVAPMESLHQLCSSCAQVQHTGEWQEQHNNDTTHLLLLFRCSNMAALSWSTPLVLLLLLLGLSPCNGVHVCDKPLAEASRICQGKGGLLIEHPHKHSGHYKLALQRLEPEGLQTTKGEQLNFVSKEERSGRQQLLFKD